MSADRPGIDPAANGGSVGAGKGVMSSAFDFDLGCVALGLVLVGVALWVGSADVEVAGLLLAALAAYAAWLDGEYLEHLHS